MPAFRSYDRIMAALEADVMTAWPDTLKVYPGWPRLQPKVYPHVIIALDQERPVDQKSDGSVQGYYQSPQFAITRVQALPADKTIPPQAQQVSDANALIAQLERNSNYMDIDNSAIAMWPVGNLDEIPAPGLADKDQVYEVSVSFACTIREFHTSKL